MGTSLFLQLKKNTDFENSIRVGGGNYDITRILYYFLDFEFKYLTENVYSGNMCGVKSVRHFQLYSIGVG